MNTDERFEILDKLRAHYNGADKKLKFHKDLVDSGVVQSCITCDRFNPGNEFCLLANQRPPAHVITLSCGKFYLPAPPF